MRSAIPELLYPSASLYPSKTLYPGAADVVASVGVYNAGVLQGSILITLQTQAPSGGLAVRASDRASARDDLLLGQAPVVIK